MATGKKKQIPQAVPLPIGGNEGTGPEVSPVNTPGPETDTKKKPKVSFEEDTAPLNKGSLSSLVKAEQGKKNWSVIDNLSDDEMQIEVCNVTGYQRQAVLLRVRVSGFLTGQVITMQGVRYHPEKGFM